MSANFMKIGWTMAWQFILLSSSHVQQWNSCSRSCLLSITYVVQRAYGQPCACGLCTVCMYGQPKSKKGNIFQALLLWQRAKFYIRYEILLDTDVEFLNFTFVGLCNPSQQNEGRLSLVTRLHLPVKLHSNLTIIVNILFSKLPTICLKDSIIALTFLHDASASAIFIKLWK